MLAFACYYFIHSQGHPLQLSAAPELQNPKAEILIWYMQQHVDNINGERYDNKKLKRIIKLTFLTTQEFFQILP